MKKTTETPSAKAEALQQAEAEFSDVLRSRDQEMLMPGNESWSTICDFMDKWFARNDRKEPKKFESCKKF